ncbi:MAG: DsbA family protein [Candidatus Competibacteraceae bacterium]|jgi:putative protein-disulfide isomerase|nr:DsbA family protein [Candidatus Competibacteraceae bacterium]
MNSVPELIYIADAMCSWCWGFVPVMDKLREDFISQLSFRLVMGGLRPGDAAVPMDAEMKTHLRTHWQAVEARSGQAFSWDWLDREGFVYDTEPAARAVVAVRRLAPTREYEFFHATQAAFYAFGRDVTQENVLMSLAIETGLDAQEFRLCYRENNTLSMTHADFRLTQELGVHGFPSVLLRDADKLTSVAQGYLPYERLEPVLRGLLS